ncbi:hypothetical protein V9T40_013086 [Parthenolecanium corni]|uniref:Uncharacterized protein n=1 Tax=Parthenolecanium corni TaxID=536013 RepID=A0AAN9Y5D1_9HEMI
MQTRSKKENKSPEIKPFPEKPFSKAKNIAILISPDKIREEPILQNLKIAKSQKGEIQLVKTKKRNIFLIFTRTNDRERFSKPYLLFMLRTFTELLKTKEISEIGIYDSFNNTDQQKKKLLETEIYQISTNISVFWIFIGEILSVEKIFYPPKTCELQLLMVYPTTNCTVSTLQANMGIWHYLGPNTWLFNTYPGQHLSLLYQNKTTVHLNLPQQGLLHLPPETTATVGEHEFSANSMINSSLEYQYSFHSTFDINTLEDIHLEPIPSFKLEKIDIETFHHLNHELEIQPYRIDLQKATRNPQSAVHWTSLGLSTIIIIIIVFALLYFCCKKRNQSTKPRTTVNVSLPQIQHPTPSSSAAYETPLSPPSPMGPTPKRISFNSA